MRELKFRVWNNRYNEFVRPDYGLIGFCYPLDGSISVLTTNGEPMEDCNLEQYTGLKDKNGKEIYEGDIVRTKSCDQPNFYAGAIEMVQQMYLIMNSAHYRDPELTHCEPLGHYCDTELEVIGNIHENPELVKEEE